MSQRGLEFLFHPKAIAVIGASPQSGRSGNFMMTNLLSGGFNGPIMPVTPRYKAVCGIMAYPDIASLPLTPDLAVLCTHAKRNLELVDALGQRGCKVAIVLSGSTEHYALLKDKARHYGMRLLGPNSLGFLAPWQGINASFSPIPIQKGKLAFISQSASVANIVLDWAKQREMGFSYFIALGDSLDIDIDELLDFLARDVKTSAILLYLEDINNARRFLSAARSASRNKPILVTKSARSQRAQSLLGSQQIIDAAFSAAIQRAGLLRVNDTHELFSAVETLSHMQPLRGERLLIVSNGAAPAAMALDELFIRQGKLAQLGEQTRNTLRAVLPNFAITNPLDLHDDATPARYLSVINTLLSSHDWDALLVIHAPSATAPSTQVATDIIEVISNHPYGKKLTILTNWCGEYSSQEARKLFTEASIPTYRTPEGAVTAFMHMVEYRRNQKQLKETPALPVSLKYNTSQAQQLISQALNQGITHLDTHEAHAILQAYGLDTLPTWHAKDSEEAVYIAEQMGYPIALKLRAPDIAHKSEIQGVMLYLRNANEVRQASEAILERATHTYPDAHIQGLLIQSMVKRAGYQELRIIVEQDAIFGPIIMLTANGKWQQEKQAAALPPLNLALARYLVLQALKSGIISTTNHAFSSIDIAGLSHVLVQVSNLILGCPEIIRLDIHPLLTSNNEFIILDVAIQLAPFQGDPEKRLAIRPYPEALEEEIMLNNGVQCLLRPILPEDEPALKTFIHKVTKEDLYYRYFSEINNFTHDDLANMTQIDYDREMAFIAINNNEIFGVTRALSDPDNINAEFAILVRSDLKGLGLGKKLLEKLINYATSHGVTRLTGMTMPSNHSMIALAQKLGFFIDSQLEEGIINLELTLTPISQTNISTDPL